MHIHVFDSSMDAEHRHSDKTGRSIDGMWLDGMTLFVKQRQILKTSRVGEAK